MKNYNIKINGKTVKSITSENAEEAIRAYAATKPNSDYGFIRKIKMIDADTHGDIWAIAITDGGEITAELSETQKITLTNDFHNTEITITVKNNILSKAQAKKAHKALCGVEDCNCGDYAGCRPQQVEENQDGTATLIY